ncbi:hypothetical protein [Marinobacterium marinum]|uniref:Uncharacterized protein n=1 Tax=Marinobacterium marinum TaxID=2756129 RepID=A0A7W1WW77_9GAMM|nr:hypothetical protein [Marinobacterium marinum]MBA4501293.1 hypothetical protein [Marinobacterium marinum]
MKRVLSSLFALILSTPAVCAAGEGVNVMQGEVTSIVAGGVVIDGEVYQLTDSTRLLGVSETEIRGKSVISAKLPLNSEVLYEAGGKKASQLIYIEVLAK